MPKLPNWENVVVPQRNRETGCIPTCFEWLIRYLKIQDIDLKTFQEDFDFGSNNSFLSVGEKIMSRYPFIKIKTQDYEKGFEKIIALKKLIENRTPCLISFAKGGNQGWHAMPVVYVNDQGIRMIEYANENENETSFLLIQDIIWRHDYLQGGKEIAWIETLSDES